MPAQCCGSATSAVSIRPRASTSSSNAAARLEIYGIRQPGCEAYAAKLECAAAKDPRVALLSALPSEAVCEAMWRCDLVVAPSRCLETGPLVVLEAFAAGTPVLGARLGGIAELVSDQVDGLLIPPDNPGAWASAIAGLAASPERVARLRAGIRKPRTMDDVAHDMAGVYRTLSAGGGG
jgi:glycosyltransferase involved in cell wall biosynthesis